MRNKFYVDLSFFCTSSKFPLKVVVNTVVISVCFPVFPQFASPVATPHIFDDLRFAQDCCFSNLVVTAASSLSFLSSEVTVPSCIIFITKHIQILLICALVCAVLFSCPCQSVWAAIVKFTWCCFKLTFNMMLSVIFLLFFNSSPILMRGKKKKKVVFFFFFHGLFLCRFSTNFYF